MNNKKEEMDLTAQQQSVYIQDITVMKDLVPQVYEKITGKPVPDQLPSVTSLKDDVKMEKLRLTLLEGSLKLTMST